MIWTRRAVRVIRFLALAGLVLSALLVPLGVMGWALDVGLWILILGIAGVVLGVALVVLATRALSRPVEIRGRRFALLATGLTVAGAEVLLSVGDGDSSLFVAFCAVFVVGFLVVAVTTHHRGDCLSAGLLAVLLLALGALLLWGQASQAEFDARKATRRALVPADLFDVRGAVAAAAPDGWHAAAIKARATDRGPLLMTLTLVLTGGTDLRRDSVTLPNSLVDLPLRGIVVVDCAGSERLEVVARGFDARAVLGTALCRPEPQVVAIEIPEAVLQRMQQYVSVDYVFVEPVDEGPTGGMNRALLLVAPTGTSDPDRDELIATFVAAFGTEDPR